jgi:hypothetical protein
MMAMYQKASWRVRALSLAIQVLLVVNVTEVASADIKVPKSLDQLYTDSTEIVYVKINSQKGIFVNNTLCGVLYSGIVLKHFKNYLPLRDGQDIVFGRYTGLDVGAEYLLFLNRYADAEAIYKDIVKTYHFSTTIPKPDAIDLIKCKGIVPGLLFDPASAWEGDDKSLEIFGLLPHPIPASIHIESVGTALWHLRKEDVFSYLQSLGKD